MDPKLTNEFHDAMLTIYYDAKRLAGYNATRFLQMVHEHGGVETAKRLLISTQISTGLAELWQKGRLDISMEALILQSRFEPLFTDGERDIARHRLAALGYPVS